MFEFVIDPKLTVYANKMTSGILISDALNKAILETRTAAMAAAPVESGLTRSIFAVVTLSTPTTLSGGVGQAARVGDPFAEAPRGTISAFLKWYGDG